MGGGLGEGFGEEKVAAGFPKWRGWRVIMKR